MKGDAERWIGIRWEFMREDPKYIEAFDRVIEIESNNTDKGILPLRYIVWVDITH